MKTVAPLTRLALAIPETRNARASTTGRSQHREQRAYDGQADIHARLYCLEDEEDSSRVASRAPADASRRVVVAKEMLNDGVCLSACPSHRDATSGASSRRFYYIILLQDGLDFLCTRRRDVIASLDRHRR